MADSNQIGFESTSIENWTKENCKQFLTKIGEEIGVDYSNSFSLTKMQFWKKQKK